MKDPNNSDLCKKIDNSLQCLNDRMDRLEATMNAGFDEIMKALAQLNNPQPTAHQRWLEENGPDIRRAPGE